MRDADVVDREVCISRIYWQLYLNHDSRWKDDLTYMSDSVVFPTIKALIFFGIIACQLGTDETKLKTACRRRTDS